MSTLETAELASPGETVAPAKASAAAYGARVVRNLGAGVTSFALNILVQIVSVPIFLHFWGKELYGEWLVLMAIPMYFAMSDVGFGNVAGTEMTILVAGGNRNRALQVFQSTWTLITAISLVLFALVAAIVPMIDLRSWLNISLMSHAQVVSVVLLLTGYVLVGQQTLLLQAGYRCEGRNALGAMWCNFSRFCEQAALVIGVCAGASAVAAACIMVIAKAFFTLVIRLHLRRSNRWMVYGREHASLATVRRLASPAISFMAIPMGFALRNQGILLVITTLLGPIAVVTFSTTRTLTNMAFQLMSMVHSAVWPEISTAFGARDLETARKLHRKACHASFWLSAAMVVALFFAGRWIYGIWTRGQVEFNSYLFCSLLLVIVVNSLWYTSSAVPMATNTHQRTAGFFLLGTCIAVLLACGLTRWLGLAGAGLSLLAIDVLMLVSVIPHSLRLLEDSSGAYVRAVLGLPRLNMLTSALRVFIPASSKRAAPAKEPL